MNIQQFDLVQGQSFELIEGQSRYGYGLSDFEEFYEIPGWLECGGYQGAQLFFFDTETMMVLCPFEKERNVTYGQPLYSDGLFYFLRADFNTNELNLYQFDGRGTPS